MYVKPRTNFHAACAINPNVIAQCCLDSETGFFYH